jgi:hypothetical protein
MRTTGEPPMDSRLITRHIRVPLGRGVGDALDPAIDQLTNEGYRVVTVVPSSSRTRASVVGGVVVIGIFAMLLLVVLRAVFVPPGPSLVDLGPVLVALIVLVASFWLVRHTTWVIYAERVDEDARKSTGT